MTNKFAKKALKLFGVFSLVFTLLSVSTIYAADPIQSTVEGTSNYFVTGESYVSDIVFSGYNSRDSKTYLNMAFETKKTVAAGKTATFNYYVEVFDNAGTKIGGVGTSLAPETITTADGATTADLKNKLVTMTSALTAEYRVVVTVKNVTVTP